MSKEHFDVVIIGSGFGGSVMAYRLAEAGMRVCVLERGKEYPPGSFARAPMDFHDNFWDPSAGKHGLFNLWSMKGIGAVVSSGVGGGSLIYANVLLRKDEKWFVKEDLGNGGYEYWPVDRAQLEQHYDAVERMLQPQRYPLEHAPYSDTAKTQAMRQAAEKLGLDWQLPRLAIAFANPGQPPRPGEPLIEKPGNNMYGVPRTTCRLCGECYLGCNFGSKQTLDHTYLSQARQRGAEIWSRSEVRSFTPRDGGGYEVSFVRHDPAHEGAARRTSSLPLVTLTCDSLVLAAGSLGSTYLLLEMKRRNPAFARLGAPLGSRFSGNGDILTFIINSREDDGKPRRLAAWAGPTITSAIRMPDTLDGEGERGRGFYIEDAGFPAFLAWIIEDGIPRAGTIRRVFQFARRYMARLLRLDLNTNFGEVVADAIGDGKLTGTSLPLLNMGRDVPAGQLFLNRSKRLDIAWDYDLSAGYLDRVRNTSKQLAGALDGEFFDNPLTYLHRLTTVHPLGGCPMGRNADEGVVDENGEVFGFPGLYVADGSVMPGPVGPNPAFTIAALADRFAENLIASRQKPSVVSHHDARSDRASPDPQFVHEFEEAVERIDAG